MLVQGGIACYIVRMDITITLTLTLLILFASGIVSIVYWTIKLGISPTPTSPKVKKTLISLFPETIKGDIHELGSGWGTLLSALQAHYPDIPLIAHERSPIPRNTSNLINYILKTKVTVTGKNIFDVDLSNAGLVICYLYPGAMSKLSKHFESMLPEGCWIISHTFHLPEWTSVQTIKAPDIYKTSIYLYRKVLPIK